MVAPGMRKIKKIDFIANTREISEKAHTLQIYKMCEAFAQNSIDISLIIPRRKQTNKNLDKISDAFTYYGVANRFKIIRVPCLDLIWIDNYTTLFSTLRFNIQATSFAFFTCIYAFFSDADIIYTREKEFAFLFGLFKKFHKKRIYFESHKFEKFICKLTEYQLIDGIIAISDALSKAYSDHQIKKSNLFVAHDGVDLNIFNDNYSREDCRKELGILCDKIIICYTGHLYHWKGVGILALSSKYLSNEFLIYLVGGTEEDRKSFNLFLLQNQIDDVKLTGYVEPLIIPKYLAAADILVLPNIETGLSHYTSPLKLFEYMSSKRPIVASNIPAIKEILHERNAILVEAGNPSALANAIMELSKDKDLGARLADCAYSEVQKFTWYQRAKNILGHMENANR